MPKTIDSLNVELKNELQIKNFDPIGIKDLKSSVNAENATAFKFTFKTKKVKHGTFIAAINDVKELIIFFSKNAIKEVTPQWTDFVEDMSNWATRKALSFKLDALDNFNDWMERREYRKGINEGYFGTKTKSYSDSTPESVKMVIKHNKQMEETDQRFRHVDQIFVENQFGERFVLPTKKPSEGYAFARLIAEGGNPYDERGKHIAQMCEDIKKLGGFIRATRNGQFNESVNMMIHEAASEYIRLRETMKKLRSSRGFRNYFENWTPTLMEESNEITNFTEMFTQQKLDPRIESAFSVLSRLKPTAITEDASLEEDLSNDAQVEELVELLSSSEELPVGPDGINSIEQIKQYIDDDELFDRLRKASGNPDLDSKPIIIGWIEEHHDRSEFKNVLDRLQEKENFSEPEDEVKNEPEPSNPVPEPSPMKQSPQKSQSMGSKSGQEPASSKMGIAPPLDLKEDELARIRKLSGLKFGA
jgi:hypothetical protein